MQIVIKFLKLFTAFLLAMLFGTSAYAVDIQLDGNITKIYSGKKGFENNNTTCDVDDIYRLGNKTKYLGEKFDLLLKVTAVDNEVTQLHTGKRPNERTVKCISIRNYVMTHSDNTITNTQALRVKLRSIGDGNTTAFVEFKLMPIKHLSNIQNGYIDPDDKIDIDSLQFTAFELDSDGVEDGLSGSDDVYIKKPGVTKVRATSHVDNQGTVKFGDFTYAKLIGYEQACGSGYYDENCSGTGTVKMDKNNGVTSLEFRVQNDDALSKLNPAIASFREIILSFENGIALGRDHGDLPMSYKDASHEVNDTLILGNAVADDEETQYSDNADADDVIDTANGKFDDENAVSIVHGATKDLSITAGYPHTTFEIMTKGKGYINAWVDSDKNGSFSENEQIITDAEVNSTTPTLKHIEAILAANAEVGSNFLRVRLSERNGTKATGHGGIGEVEDYAISILASGSIHGFVFKDLNKNGIKDGNETGFADVNVTVTAANGETQSVQTGSEGNYSFGGVALGEATIAVDDTQITADHYELIGTDNPAHSSIVANTIATQNFGYALGNADLVTSKTVDNKNPDAGDIIHFRIRVENKGPADATNVSLTDKLPTGLIYLDHNLSQGLYDPSVGQWKIGTIANGAVATLDIEVQVGPKTAEQTITNVVTDVNSSVPDLTPDGDDLNETIVVGPEPIIGEINITNTRVVEGGDLIFDINLSKPSNFNTVFDLVSVGGSATPRLDYDRLPSTYQVGIPKGATHAQVIIPTIDDTLVEDDETIVLNFKVYRTNNLALNETLTATGLIIDNDEGGVKSVTNANAIEDDVLTHKVEVAHKDANQTYSFVIEDIDTEAGKDYNATPTFTEGVTLKDGEITIPANVTSFDVKIKSLPDEEIENNETYNIKVGDVEATGTIEDGTPARVKSVSDASALEDANLTHKVEVTKSATEVTYVFKIENNTTENADYETPPIFDHNVSLNGEELTVPAGVTDFNVTVHAIKDAIVDDNETYTMTVGTEHGIGTIRDDSNATILAITDAHAKEGEPLIHEVNVTASTTEKSYDFNIEGQTATEGYDYNTTPTFTQGVTLENGKIMVPKNVSNFNIEIQALQDDIYEGNETYIITVGDKNAIGTIENNGRSDILRVGNATGKEGSILTHEVSVTNSTMDRTYPFSIENNTTDNDDYDTPPEFDNGVTFDGTEITVPLGVSTFNINVTSREDNLSEYNETYILHVGDKNATGTIEDNTSVSVISISDGRSRESVEIEHTVLLNSAPNEEIELPYILENDTVTDDDYYQSITIKIDNDTYPNATINVVADANDVHKGVIFVKGVKEFIVKVETVLDDIANEDTEEFYNITVGGKTARGTIVDDS